MEKFFIRALSPTLCCGLLTVALFFTGCAAGPQPQPKPIAPPVAKSPTKAELAAKAAAEAKKAERLRKFQAAGTADKAGRHAEALKIYLALMQEKTDYDKEAGVLAIQAARKMNPPPAIPEEANKHFIYAITALKNAGNKADLGVAIGEYKLAIKNAPWVPDYYWNLSLAYEQAEQFEKSASMLEDFKTIALNFPNPQVIEDKIFELQYKQKEQGKKQEQERLAQEKIQREQNYATQQRERCSKKCGDDANIFNIFESYESFARKLDACQARCKTRY